MELHFLGIYVSPFDKNLNLGLYFSAMSSQKFCIEPIILSTLLTGRHLSCMTEETWLVFKNLLTRLIGKCKPVVTIKNQCTAPRFTQQLHSLNSKKSDSANRLIKVSLWFPGYVAKLAINNNRHYFKPHTASFILP